MKTKSSRFTKGIVLAALLGLGLTSTLSASAQTPIRLQAEDYDEFFDSTPGNTGGVYRNDAVDIQAATGGGYNVGWIVANEWLKHTDVVLPTSGQYTIRARVASLNAGGQFAIDLNSGAIFVANITVPQTGGWQTWQIVEAQVTLQAGTYDLGMFMTAGGFNIDWIELVPPAPPAPATNISLQAEDYDEFFDTTAGNTGGAYRNDAVDIQALTAGGGFNVGWIVANEWLKFTDVVIPASGQHTIRARVASPNTGAQFAVDLDSGAVFLANMVVPNTGGWQNFQVIQATVNIPAGTYDLGLFMTMGGFNLDWVEIVSGSSGSSSSSSSSSSSAPGAVWKTAQQAAVDMGAGFNLGNVFEGNQNASTFALSKPKIDAYYAKGFRNVRIPITWTENIDGTRLANQLTGVVDRNHPRLAQIQQTVDYALSLPGMHVVINAHHETGLKDNSGTRGAVFERLWQDITDIFGNRDSRLMFQLLNEPHLSEAFDQGPMPVANIRALSGRAYNRIRAVNPQRIVMIGGDQWFGSWELPRVWPNLDPVGGGNDPYVMASHHHYEPFTFSGQDGNHAMAWTNATIEGPFNTTSSWANTVGNGMPIYVSEWGVGWAKNKATMSCNNIRLWYQEMHSDHAVSRGYPTAVWDDGGWFKIFDHGTNSFNNNLVDCITGQCAWTGTARFNSGCY